VAISFGILVQNLPRRTDRVLAVASLVAARSDSHWFRPRDLLAMFEALRLPPPGNVSQDLTRLGAMDFVRRRDAEPPWALTPLGEEAVDALIGEIDPAAVEAELSILGSAEFDRVRHPLIPPELAPAAFRTAIDGVLEVSPFERNVFLMTRFPPDDDAEHPLSVAIEVARGVLEEHGLTPHMASDRQADDQLFGNVAAHMWAAKYGLAFLESLDTTADDRELNDNVLIEVGAMVFSGRRCGLLKDPTAPVLPTDVVAQIYKSVDLSDTDAVADAVRAWVRDDLRLR
jgi:hypothetical protein